MQGSPLYSESLKDFSQFEQVRIPLHFPKYQKEVVTLYFAAICLQASVDQKSPL